MNEQRKSKPMQGQLLDMPADSYAPPNLRVNCATLARMFNVSRTTIKRYVDDGKIKLDDNMLACPKQAAKSVLESATAGRAKAKFFKTQIDSTTALQNEIAELQKQLADMKAKLDATQNELEQITNLYDQNGDDYFVLDDAITAFIDALVNDDDLKTAVFEGNRQFMQNAFDNLLELENESN